MAELQLLRPLWLLAIIPLVYLVWRLWRCQPTEQDWTGICDQHLLPQQLDGGDKKSSSAILCLIIGWLLTVVALAGPSWHERPQTATVAGDARVIVLDLSTAMAMAAQPTAKTTNRLGRVHTKLAEILRDPDPPATALIVFAQYPYLIAPLTDDLNTLGAVIPELTPEIMPLVMNKQGYRLDRALALAQQLLTDNNVSDGEVLVITTGDNDANHALASARELAGHRYRLSILSLEKNSPLAQLAQLGGGNFAILTPDDRDLKLLLTHSNPQRNRGNSGAVIREDNGHWLLILLLPVAAISFRRGWLATVMLPLVLASSLMILPTGTVVAGQSTPDPQVTAELAQDAYLDRDYVKAEQLWRQLTGVEALYNRGNVLVRLGRYKDALAVYQQVIIREPEHQDGRINYDLVAKFLEQPDQDDNDGDSEDSDQQNDDQRQGSHSKGSQDNASPDRRKDQNNGDNSGSAGNNSPQQSSASDQAQATGSNLSKTQRNQQQLVRWLDRVPEQPASLLRQKLLRQHKRRGYPEPKAEQ